jgi:hypothetical protein
LQTQFERSDKYLLPCSYYRWKPGDTWHPGQFRVEIRVPKDNCPIKFAELWDLPITPPPVVFYDWFERVRDYGLTQERQEFYTATAIAEMAKEAIKAENWEISNREIEDIIYGYARAIGDYLAPEKPATEDVA